MKSYVNYSFRSCIARIFGFAVLTAKAPLFAVSFSILAAPQTHAFEIPAMQIHDDFSDSDTAYSTNGSGIGTAWVNSRDTTNWKITNGTLMVNSAVSGPAVLYNTFQHTGSAINRSFTNSADVTALIQDAWVGIAFNYQNDTNFYAVRFKGGTASYQLYRRVNGSDSALVSGTASSTFQTGVSYTITVSSDTAYQFDFAITETGSSTILNSKTSGTDSDSNFTDGYAGLYNTKPGEAVKYDNFYLSAVDGNFPNDIFDAGNTNGLAIDAVWSGHPVNFELLTLRNIQVAAYYNQLRQLTLAVRNLDSTVWIKKAVQPVSTIGWDSHNYLTMAMDDEGFLHLSGNLHRDPMNYWRSRVPLTDASQLTTNFMAKISELVNSNNELQVTYPEFITGPKEEFIFAYRNHTAENEGSRYLLKYDTASQTFSQATGSQPLFSWTNHYSVYPTYTVHDGSIHCLYVWRKPGGADQNYNLSYMRSANLTNWVDSFGNALTLPVTPSTTNTLIDAVPVQGGLLNGQPKLSFDRDGQPLALYHKYDTHDTNGHSQVYIARPDSSANSWKIAQLTDNSDWIWNFSGGGTLPPGGSVGNRFDPDDPCDGLASVYVKMTNQDGIVLTNTTYLIDESSLNIILADPSIKYYSANEPAGNSSFVDSSTLENLYTNNNQTMIINRYWSKGLDYAGLHYYLRWETLPANRDQPRLQTNKITQIVTEISPDPSILRLYRTNAELDTPTTETQSPFYGRMFTPANATLGGEMARTFDKARRYGEYLSSPIAGTTNYAEWTFTVPVSGMYALGGSTYSQSSSDDSFYVEMANDPRLDWHINGRWDYQPVTLSSSKGMMRFYLTAGTTNTIRLCAREGGAKVEYLWLNKPSMNKVSALQALDYQGFDWDPDITAASGYSLHSPNGSTSEVADYQIPVPATGTYRLLGRTRAADGQSDSFKLAINGGSTNDWHLPQSSPDWQWKTTVDGSSLSLTNGTFLDLEVIGRESGSELDTFMLLYTP